MFPPLTRVCELMRQLEELLILRIQLTSQILFRIESGPNAIILGLLSIMRDIGWAVDHDHHAPLLAFPPTSIISDYP